MSNSSYLTQKGLRQIQLGQVIPSSANTLNLASNLVSLSKSNVYFLCDTKITSFDLANSIPEKYLKVPRSLISNSLAREFFNLFNLARLTPIRMISSTYTISIASFPSLKGL